MAKAHGLRYFPGDRGIVRRSGYRPVVGDFLIPLRSPQGEGVPSPGAWPCYFVSPLIFYPPIFICPAWLSTKKDWGGSVTLVGRNGQWDGNTGLMKRKRISRARLLPALPMFSLTFCLLHHPFLFFRTGRGSELGWERCTLSCIGCIYPTTASIRLGKTAGRVSWRLTFPPFMYLFRISGLVPEGENKTSRNRLGVLSSVYV